MLSEYMIDMTERGNVIQAKIERLTSQYEDVRTDYDADDHCLTYNIHRLIQCQHDLIEVLIDWGMFHKKITLDLCDAFKTHLAERAQAKEFYERT